MIKLVIYVSYLTKREIALDMYKFQAIEPHEHGTRITLLGCYIIVTADFETVYRHWAGDVRKK